MLNITPRADGAQTSTPAFAGFVDHSQFMVADLAKSGLVPADMETLSSQGGYKIPYYDPATGAQHAQMYRIRIKDPKDGQRYAQPSKDQIGEAATLPYFPRQLHGMDCTTLAICEGEKKARAVIKYTGIPALGIGGCHNGVKGRIEVHPEILAFAKRRGVTDITLVPDGDVHRYDIAAAYGTLAALLREEGFAVRVLKLPRNKKIDDLLVEWGVEHAKGAFAALPEVGNLVESPAQLAKTYGLATYGKDSPQLYANEATALTLLRQHPAFPKIWFNQDTFRIIIGDAAIELKREVVDILTFLQFNLRIPKIALQTVRCAIGRCAYDDSRSPFKDWLLSLRWDGTHRLESFFQTYCQTPDSEFVREAGRKWLTGSVWRTFEPGCPIDYMLITQGPQDIGKSSLPDILWGVENVVDVLGSELQTKDNLSKFHEGKCIKFEEFDQMQFQDIGRLKGTITSRKDTFRRPYDPENGHYLRSSVLYATTNKNLFLKNDETGYRRFVVIPCGQVAFDALKHDRAQLWAEAVAAYQYFKASGKLFELSGVKNTTAMSEKYASREDFINDFETWLSDPERPPQTNKDPRDQILKGFQFLTTKQVYAGAGLKDVDGNIRAQTWEKNAIKEHLLNTKWTEKASWLRGDDGRQIKNVWVRELNREP